MPKNIVVFSDGTGQDGGVRPEQTMSNVYKLYRASRVGPQNVIDPREQVAFYDPGLGTDIGATALTAPVRFVQKLLASVIGSGITTNIADCYEFIINHYQPGDRIFLIGFSRGAYTVRCVANLLMLCGVPTKTPAGKLMRFRKQARDIAEEAVNDVLEFGAGHPRADFEPGRLEMARRFRKKYGSDGEPDEHDPEPSNAAPHFIGVFDTVAALGAQGTQRRLIHLGLGAGVAFASALLLALPAAAVSGLAHGFVGTHFWWVTFAVLAAGVGVTNVLWWRKQKAATKKTIRDFPNPGDVQTHYAEWKGDNFDRLLSRHVHYARSANAIDETRKDFDRVAWGSTGPGIPETFEGLVRMRQWWFAGNHSDVGGSYPETESRLSDAALHWMIEQATEIPNGLKLGPGTVNGEKVPGTGDTGEPLHLFPSADGVQHCEIAGMRDTLDQRAAQLPWFLRMFLANKNWDVKVRDIPHDAKVHETVRARFGLPSVIQCAAGAAPYRPEALKSHDEFKTYWPAPKQETESAVAEPATTPR